MSGNSLKRLCGGKVRRGAKGRNLWAEPPVGYRNPGPGPGGRVIDRYFELSAATEGGKSDRDYQLAIAAARETYPIPSEVVR